MELNWNTYENVTRLIYEALGRDVGVKILGYGNACKVLGKSGVSHQIDVLTGHSDGIHTYKTAIECKYWKESINKDIIMKVAEIVEDSSLNKGVIVSKQGFTEDAQKFAEYKNIGLVELRELTAEEKQPKIYFDGVGKLTIYRPEIIKIIVKPSLFDRSPVDSELVIEDRMIVKTRDGNSKEMKFYTDSFRTELQNSKKPGIVEKDIFIPMSELIDLGKKRTLYIDGFTIIGRLNIIHDELKFYPWDEVWLKMKSIFENKSYTITKRGYIQEDKMR